MITMNWATLTEKTAEIEEATIALFADRSDLSGEGNRYDSVREGVAALIAAGPPATLFVRAKFDWGEPEKYFDAREGDVEDAHVREVLEYFSVQRSRNT
jgi:hypothetical protein